MDTVGLIPCAGKGSRLSLPFSKELYPASHTTGYAPVILSSIREMKEAGIEHIIITIHPSKYDLMKYLGNGRSFGVQLTYCMHPNPLSLPDSIDEAYHLIRDVRTVLALPDTVIEPPGFMKQLLSAHMKDPGRSVTLGCFLTDRPAKFGMVDLDFGSGLIRSIHDKPSGTTLKWMWGVMVWDPQGAEELHRFVQLSHSQPQTSGEIILSDAFIPLIRQGLAYGHCFPDLRYWDLGTFDEIALWTARNQEKR